MMTWIFIFFGGGLGSLARYGISAFFQRQGSFTLPVATLLANLVSCLIFGLVFYIYQQRDLIPESVRVFLLIGFCGGLSTFSTFSYETFELIKRGDLFYAILNVAISVVLCVGIFYVFANKSA